MRVTKLGPNKVQILNTNASGNLVDTKEIPVYQVLSCTPQVMATLLSMPQTPAPEVPFGAYADALHQFSEVTLMRLVEISDRFHMMFQHGILPCIYGNSISFPLWDEDEGVLRPLVPKIRQELRAQLNLYPLLKPLFPEQMWRFRNDGLDDTEVELRFNKVHPLYQRVRMELNYLKRWGKLDLLDEGN